MNRVQRLKPTFDELLAEANRPPQGMAWHSEMRLVVPIDVGEKIVIGAIKGSNLSIFQECGVGRRLGMGTYRVGFIIVPEESASAGIIIA
jgi:hypothetical protein